MKFSFSKIFLFLVSIVGPVIGFSQFAYVEGSSVNSAGIIVNYMPKSNGVGQVIVNKALEFEVSADFGEVTNAHMGMGEVYIDYEVDYYYQGNPITQSGSLEVSPEKLKDSRKYMVLNFDATNKVLVKVVSVTYGSGTTSTPNNLRLSLGVAPKYGYGLYTGLTNNSSNITHPRVSSNTLGGQKLLIEWMVNNNSGYFEEYELQVMKVEPQHNQSSSAFIKDWNKALKVKIKNGETSYEYMPSEGAGYYVWRVRGIGSAYNGGSTNYKNFGDWINPGGYASISNFYVAGVDVSGSYKLINNTTGGSYNPYSATVNDNEFFVSEANSFELSKNWSYMQQFAENGKRKEVVTYANGLNQVKQTQTLLNTADEVVANATLYDYEGRTALNTMMAPTGSNVFDYDENFILNSSGNSYTAADFDRDNNMWSPSGVHSSASLSQYYGEDNTKTMDGLFVANGEEKTFTRNIYTPDATGRVWVQGGVGTVLQISDPLVPADNRNTVVEYAAVAQDELDYIFGNEAPLAENVYKTSTKDPNSVLSINYMTKKGEVLATLLDGAKVSDFSERLTPVDGFNTLTINDNLPEASVASDLFSTYSTKNLMIMGTSTFSGEKADPVSFGYSFTGAEMAQICDLECPDCDYKVYLTITNAKYPTDYSRNIRVEMDIAPGDISNPACGSTAFTGTNLLSGTVPGVTLRAIDYTNTSSRGDVIPNANINSFLAGIVSGGQIYLKPGVYTIEKSVVINDLKETTTGETYLDYYLNKLEEDATDWDMSSNCCGINSVPTISWECDDQTNYDCSSTQEITGLADKLWGYIEDEQTTILNSNMLPYTDALNTNPSDLLSHGITNSGSPTASYSLIESWMGCPNNTGIDFGVISQCIDLYGNILENNIAMAESMGNGTLLNVGTGAGAFNPDFDFLLNVVNCLGVSYSGSNSHTTCSKWVDIYDYGVNGSSLSGVSLPSNQGVIVKFNAITSGGLSSAQVLNSITGSGLTASQIKVVEVYHSNFYVQGASEFDHNTSGDKTIAGANTNCVKYLTYPSSLANSGSQVDDRKLLAEMACNCLENLPTDLSDLTNDFASEANSKDMVMECEELCEENRVIYEVAYNNRVLAQNIAINNTSDIYSPNWEEDILGVDKECQIDLMVASCKQKCHKPLHTFLADRAADDISNNTVNAFQIPSSIVLNPPVSGGVDLTNVYSFAGVQNKLAEERQDLEDIFTGTAYYAPVGTYNTIDFQNAVKEEIVEFFNERLEYDLSNRGVASPFNSDFVLKSSFVSTSNMRMSVSKKVFELANGTNSVSQVTAQTTVIFDDAGTSEIYTDDIILELNVRLYCEEPLDPIFWWAVGANNQSELEDCGIFYGYSPAGYNIPFHIVDFSFDQYNNFHAVPSENFCWISDPSWFEYYNTTSEEHTADLSIDMSSYTAGDDFWLRYVNGTNSSPLMDNPVELTGSYSNMANQVMAEINASSTSPICRAKVTGNVVKLLFFQDEIIDVSGNSTVVLEKISGTSYTNINQTVTSLAALGDCDSGSPSETDCPYGYELISGATSSASLMDLDNPSLMKIQGDKIAQFWVEGLETLVNSRNDVPSSDLLIPSAYTAVSTFASDPAVVETVDTESYELWKTWNTPQGVLRAIIHVEAQASTASHEISSGNEGASVWVDASENRIISVRYKLEVLCGENDPVVWVDLTMGKGYYTCLPGYTQYTGTLYENEDPNNPGTNIPPYVAYMYNDPFRVAVSDISYDAGKVFQFTINDLMHTYADDPQSFSSPFFTQGLGAETNIEFSVVSGRVTDIPYGGEGTPFDTRITCNMSALQCDVCMRYTFEVDNTILDPVAPISCEEMRAQMQQNAIADLLAACLESKKDEFRTEYKSCISKYSDNLSLSYPIKTGQYTLYYYDRAGNLIQTVPPAGVNLLSSGNVNTVKTYRNGTGSPVYPSHSLITKYRYNSLKQLVWQSTPDGGESQFGYNDLGQLIISQNAQQEADGKYSYSLYDELGRIVEVGQSDAPSGSLPFDDVVDLAKAGSSWISNATETVRTKYGAERNGTINIPNQVGGNLTVTLENIRNRVVMVTNNEQTTFYSYDMHGNVKKLIHNINEIGIKILEYEYDLVSGNVNQVKYNPHGSDRHEDQFYHRYEYDADNRITKVYTSQDGVIWDRDAAYEYYLHGPLSRAEIGQDEIQGIDYVYTLQGFLKSVNAVDLAENGRYDKGADGAPVATITINSVTSSNNPTILISNQNVSYTLSSNKYNLDTPKGYAYAFAEAINGMYDMGGSIENRLKAEWLNGNQLKVYATGENTLPYGFAVSVSEVSVTTTDFDINSTAHDGFAMELGYFNRDYDRHSAHVGINSTYDPYQSSNASLGGANELFNGNISTWLTNTYTNQLSVDAYDIKMNVYRYDALNRVLRSDFQYWDSDYQNDDERYDESFSYDPNGNFKSVVRMGIEDELVDELDYNYYSGTNQLDFIQDGGSVLPADKNDFHIGDQSSENYIYDKNGNLIEDKYGEISTIKWNVIGKVKTVVVDGEKTINFGYDGSGNRIWKETINADDELVDKQYYVRDATGNVMAIYKKYIDSELKLDLTDVPLYGSDRLGIRKMNQNIVAVGTYSGKNPQLTTAQTQTVFNNGYTYPLEASRLVGLKAYELKDHLGNVRSVVSDKKNLTLHQNNYLELDGSGDYVVIPNNSEFNISNNLTIEAWINPTDLTGHNMIATKKNCSGGQFSYYFTVKDGVLQWVWSSTGSCGTNYIDVYRTNTAVVQANMWQHVAVVHGNGTVKFYVDGVEITNSSYRSGDSFSSIKVSNAPTVIGAYHSSGSTYVLEFEGGIDDVRIWNSARTSAQIVDNKDSEPVGTESNLVASYNFNTSTTSTVIDNTITASSGTLMGNPVRLVSSSNGGTPWCYSPQVLSISDYYAFGSLMPKRNASSDVYRYGFNGMEKDDEAKGTGNSYDFGARIYDPRVGKFLSLDPRMGDYPFMSPYCFAGNSPVLYIDENGEGPYPGVVFTFAEIEVGGGLGYGVNAVFHVGVARDEVGKTHFAMTNFIYVANQSRVENTMLVWGAAASASGMVRWSFAAETFMGINKSADVTYVAELSDGPGFNFGVGEWSVILGVGLGTGAKITAGPMYIMESISLTDKEADKVNALSTQDAVVWGVERDKDNMERNADGLFEAYVTEGEGADKVVTDIKIYSEDGKQWMSKDYKTEATEAEEND